MTGDHRSVESCLLHIPMRFSKSLGWKEQRPAGGGLPKPGGREHEHCCTWERPYSATSMRGYIDHPVNHGQEIFGAPCLEDLENRGNGNSVLDPIAPLDNVEVFDSISH